MQECLERAGVARARVLEIGCGTAIDSYILAEKSNAEITGIDLSVPSIKVAARCGAYFNRPILLAAADATRMPFASGTFDIVFSQGVVEHFRDPSAMLVEQLRVMKHGGILVINVPQKRTGYTRYKHSQMADGTWPWGWETEYSPGELRKLGRSYGLDPIAMIGYDHWGSRRGTLYWRHAHTRLQQRNRWRERAPFRALETAYERTWVALEETAGPYFLINLTMAFVRQRNG